MNNNKQIGQEFKKRKRTRLKDYNYSEAGYYFVTVCSKDRKNIFGEYDKNIVGEGLAPSRYKDRKISCDGQPQGLSLHAPVRYNSNIKLSALGHIIDKQWNDIPNQYDDIELDEYVIMPNHIHGILIINKRTINERTGASPVPTVSISNIIGSFKSKTSIEYLQWIKKNILNVSGQIWQRSFYDHVIRNDKSLDSIRVYIMNNPLQWDDDVENINKNHTSK